MFLQAEVHNLVCDKVKMPEKPRELSEWKSSDPVCETLVLS